MTKVASDYKKRTREHIIADLSVNYVERIVLECGHYIDRVQAHDYGYDGQLFTVNQGDIENGSIMLQFKASYNVKYVKNRSTISFVVSRADTNLWGSEGYPVVLIVWDAVTKVAYWLYVQKYLKKTTKFPLKQGVGSLTVNIPTTNVVDNIAVEEFRRIKNDIIQQMTKGVNYDV